jgi:hypothetical protein
MHRTPAIFIVVAMLSGPVLTGCGEAATINANPSEENGNDENGYEATGE